MKVHENMSGDSFDTVFNIKSLRYKAFNLVLQHYSYLSKSRL